MAELIPTKPEFSSSAHIGSMEDYQRRWKEGLFQGRASPDIVCNHLTEPHGEFMGDERRTFCTDLVSTVAALVAEVALRHGAVIEVTP